MLRSACVKALRATRSGNSALVSRCRRAAPRLDAFVASNGQLNSNLVHDFARELAAKVAEAGLTHPQARERPEEIVPPQGLEEGLHQGRPVRCDRVVWRPIAHRLRGGSCFTVLLVADLPSEGGRRSS